MKTAILIVAMNVIAIGLLIDRGLFFTDFVGQWQLCAYTLHNLDPYQLIGVETPAIETLGVIPRGWGTVPWGLLLGNVFYGGFLTLGAAKIYFLTLNIIVLIITARLFYIESKRSPWALILFACPASFAISTITGNAGAVICALLLISLVIRERRPILTAVLLSLAMIKPQTALAFCLFFLFERRWRILLIAAIIDVAAWLIVSIMVAQSPFTLLKEFFAANIGGGSQFSGIFTLLIDTPLQSIALSMTVGAAFIWFWRKKIWAPCLASAFWSYSYFNEFYLLSLPAIECVRMRLFTATILLQVGETFWTAVALWHRRMIEIGATGFFVDNNLIAEVFRLEYWIEVRTVFCLIIIAIGFLLHRQTRREC